jgi:hypothetical protein
MLEITSRMQPCGQLPQQDGPQQGNPINTILLQTMRRLHRGALCICLLGSSLPTL